MSNLAIVITPDNPRGIWPERWFGQVVGAFSEGDSDNRIAEKALKSCKAAYFQARSGGTAITASLNYRKLAHMNDSKTTCQPAQNAGQSKPVIDRNRCEGKADCVRVCPYDVFEIGKIDAEQKKQLSLRGRLKAFGHGGKQAFVVQGEACRACQLCVQSCPEQAIKLI